MDCMNSGCYKQMNLCFSQNSCVICLEQFKIDSHVHIINSCLHCFHTKCLEEWFQNISTSQDLCCPHCKCGVSSKIICADHHSNEDIKEQLSSENRLYESGNHLGPNLMLINQFHTPEANYEPNTIFN